MDLCEPQQRSASSPENTADRESQLERMRYTSTEDSSELGLGFDVGSRETAAAAVQDAGGDGSGASTIASKKRKDRPIAKACNECARRKAKCSGGQPCVSCSKYESSCEYAPAQRRGPKVKKTSTTADREQSQQQTRQISTAAGEEQGLSILAQLSRYDNGEAHDAGSSSNGLPALSAAGSTSMTNAASHTWSGLPLMPPSQQQHGLLSLMNENDLQDSDMGLLNSDVRASYTDQASPHAEHNTQSTYASGAYREHDQARTAYSAYTGSINSGLQALLEPSGQFSSSQEEWSGPTYSAAQQSLPIVSSSSASQHGPTDQFHAALGNPSPGGESNFAQSFYEADGPGLHHFHDVLSRDFDVRDGDKSANADAGARMPEVSTSSTFTLSPAYSEAQLPPEMERDLVNLADAHATQVAIFAVYWCFVHPQWPVIYRPACDFDRVRESPALFNAMLSVTCRQDVSRQLQHVPGTLKNLPLSSRLGEVYAKRAIRALDLENMPSSLQHVQALFMLSLRDVSQGLTSRGWMWAGMSVRMAFDLQLHHPTRQTNASSPTSSILIQERSRTIWCCFALDKSMSLFLGRPSTLYSSEIEASLPSKYEADEFSYWAEDAKLVLPDRVALFAGVQARCVTTLLAFIKLLVIVEDIMSKIYKPKSGPGRASETTAVELNKALDDWRRDSAEILAKAEDLPRGTTNVYLLLLWYHASRLILNRPFIPRNRLFFAIDGEKSAYTLCIDSANMIVSIVGALERTHGIFRCSYTVLFIIFQAGVMHCLTASTAKDPIIRTEAIQSLRQCDGWLEAMTETYKCGAQYRDVLMSMERLSKRELRDETQVTEIIASRRGSRAPSPVSASNDTAVSSILYIGVSDNPLVNLHHTFWDMPLSIPIQNSDMESWMNWENDYGSLLLDITDGSS